MANFFLATASCVKKRYQRASKILRGVGHKLKAHLAERQLTFAQLVLRAIGHALFGDEILSRAAAIAFWAMLAFVPFITLAITFGVHLLPDLGGLHANSPGAEQAAKQVAEVLQTFFPAGAAALILEQIARIQADPPIGIISITLLLALWSSSSLYSEIINALNRILGVAESRPYWRLKLTTMGMVLLQTGVVFAAFFTVVFWPQLTHHINHLVGSKSWLNGAADVVHWLIFFAIIYFSFAIVFHFGPDGKKRQHWVSPGSFFGSLVFMGTAFGFRVYLEYFARYSSAYGSLGGVMMLMIWFWLMSCVLLIATEINKLAALAETKK